MFLLLEDKEMLYGGAAGGGKSEALLAGALQYVDEPTYAGILLRRTYQDLSKPGALIDRSRSWLSHTPAKWDQTTMTWHFPSGAQLAFGYIRNDKDLEQYQSAEFQYIGIDELTQFTKYQYRFLFSRLRRKSYSTVPLRMRAGSNPGGVGHEWVKERWRLGSKYDEAPPKGRRFLPALLDENPHLDRAAYLDALAELDPVMFAQLRQGNWDVIHEGTKFKRSWFKIVDDEPDDLRCVRYWDLAATEAKPGTDPDWTVGLRLGRADDGQMYVCDVARMRGSSAAVDKLVARTAKHDGVATRIRMEQEPGSSGKRAIDYFRREILQGYDFAGDKTTGSKEVRANPVSSSAEKGDVTVVRGEWNEAFFDELGAFPLGEHDDQVDALSGAWKHLTARIIEGSLMA